MQKSGQVQHHFESMIQLMLGFKLLKNRPNHVSNVPCVRLINIKASPKVQGGLDNLVGKRRRATTALAHFTEQSLPQRGRSDPQVVHFQSLRDVNISEQSRRQ